MVSTYLLKAKLRLMKKSMQKLYRIMVFKITLQNYFEVEVLKK